MFLEWQKFPHPLKNSKRNTRKLVRHCFAVPETQKENVKQILGRMFLNNKAKKIESLNWRADWKIFAGVSYANVVKINSRNKLMSTKQNV